MGKVILNEDRCIGCGACMSVAPDNFTFNDEGRAEIINSEINDNAIEASEICPVNAITVENGCSCGHDCNCNADCHCDDNCQCDDNCGCGCK